MMKGVRGDFKLKVLTDEKVERIHEASLDILERTGVRFDSEKASQILIDNGAVKHPSRKGVLTFPKGLVEDSIKRIPRYGTYYARDPDKDLVFDGETTYAHTEGGNPNIIDLETGEMRMSTLKDVVDGTRLADALDNCHLVTTLTVATDVPGPLVVVKTMEAIMRNTSKTFSGYALKEEEVNVLFEMGAVLAGGAEALRKRPLFTVYGSPSSPLTYDAHVCDVMLRSAQLGIPVDLVPCPICGGTAPMTLAGGLAQQNAELLAGVILTQTQNARLPSMYSGRLTFLDPRSGRNIWGVPEMALTSAATVQMAHRYNMTADIYGVTTDDNSWSMQLGMERMMIAMAPALAGADALSGIGGTWNNAVSFEMMVIDHELYSQLFRVMQGIEVDDDRLALNVIDKVGPMGNYLGQMHTLKHIRSGEFRISPLFDKRPFDRAMREGLKPLNERAGELAKKILKDHRPMPLDRDQDKELTRVVKSAEHRLLGKG